MPTGSKVVGMGAHSGTRQASVFFNQLPGGQFYQTRRLPPAPSVVFDSFTSGDGETLAGRVPDTSQDGAAWAEIVPDAGTPAAGSVTIQGYQAAISLGAEGIAIETGLADVDLEFDLVMGTATKCGAILRAASNGNVVSVRVRQPEALIEVVTWTAGVSTIVGTSQALTSVAGQLYRFRIRAEGTRITAWRDGVQVLDQSGVSAHQTATKHGFTSYGSSFDERYDNFRVGPITAGTPSP